MKLSNHEAVTPRSFIFSHFVKPASECKDVEDNPMGADLLAKVKAKAGLTRGVHAGYGLGGG